MDLLLVYQYTTQNLFLSLLGLKKIKTSYSKIHLKSSLTVIQSWEQKQVPM